MGVRGGSNNGLKYIAVDTNKELVNDTGAHTISIFLDGGAAQAPTNAPLNRGNGNFWLPLTAAESIADIVDASGSSATAGVMLIFDQVDLDVTPAVPGDAMTLTADERTAVANVVEQEIINEADPERVLQAITDAIAAANPDLGGLTLSAIGAAARDAILDRVLAGNHTTAGSVGLLLQFLDVAVSSRSNHSAADVVAAMGLVADTFKADLTNVATQADVNAARDAITTAGGAGPWTGATGFATPANVTDAKDEILTRGDAGPWTTGGAASGFATAADVNAARDAVLTRGGTGPWTTGSAGGGNLTSEQDAAVRGTNSRVRALADALLDTTNQGDLTIKEADTWVGVLDCIGDLSGDAVIFTAKCKASDADAQALINIDSRTGLTVLAQTTYTGAATDGSITVDNTSIGNLRIGLTAAATAQLANFTGFVYYAIKVIRTGGTPVETVKEGRLTIGIGVSDTTA